MGRCCSGCGDGAGAERCGNARVLRDAGTSGQCPRERASANLSAAHVRARPHPERALCAGRPDDRLCRRVGRPPDAALRDTSVGSRVAADWPPGGRPGQHLLERRDRADSELPARLGELCGHARQNAAGRRRSPRSAGRRRQRGLDARRAAARRHPDHRGRVPAPVPDRQIAL